MFDWLFQLSAVVNTHNREALNAAGEYLVTISHDSWAEAMAQADRLADIIRRYWNNHPEGDQA